MSKAIDLQAEAEIEIPFYDLDPMNVVWHGNYANYFELARSRLLAKINYSYAEMKESGYFWPVIDLHIRFVRPATFGQKLICCARLVEYENRLKIAYTIACKQTGERLTKGTTVQVAVDSISGEMQFVSPQIILQKLGVSDAT